MKLNEVMTKDPQYVKLNTPLIEVARQMRDLDVGMLPVGDGIKLKGMVTDRDIAIRVVAEGKDLKTVVVQDIMTPEVLYAFEDEEVEKAIETMKRKQIRRLVVLNKDKDMVGIVALADIASEPLDSDQKAEALKGVSED